MSRRTLLFVALCWVLAACESAPPAGGVDVISSPEVIAPDDVVTAGDGVAVETVGGCGPGAPCPTGSYCAVGGVCAPQKADGLPCSADDADHECLGGECDNGFCCATVAAVCCGVDDDCAHLATGAQCVEATTCTGGSAAATCVQNVCVSTPTVEPAACAGAACGAAASCAGLRHTAAAVCDVGGACQAGAVTECDDGDPCTDDACDPAGGCSHTPHTRPCDDGDICTTDDACSPTGCTGAPLDCDDGDACTTETCIPFQGCQYVHSTTACTPHYKDQDGDGFGAPGETRCLCRPEGDFLAISDADCDDTNADIHPARGEDCATVYDDNCDGVTNVPDAAGCTAYLEDQDGDTYGRDGSSRCLCVSFAPFTATRGGDCDDYTASVHPGGSDPTCDGLDDDCDGRVDEDWTVSAAPTCGEGPCAATGSATCRGGQVVTDCTPKDAVPCDDGDPCTSASACVRGTCFPTALDCAGADCERTSPYCRAESCVDGLDNDSDGRTDCADSDCDGSPCRREPLCGTGSECRGGQCVDLPLPETCNGVDDDCDGRTDEDWPVVGTPCPSLPAPSGCFQHARRCRSTGSLYCERWVDGTSGPCAEVCVGGLDEDDDGLVDCQDPDCSCATEVQCGDGHDDDRDGDTDCDDPDCHGRQSCPLPDEVCDDGVDNDLDGLTDCDDRDCDVIDADVASPCPREFGDDVYYLGCEDGTDNDGDGLTDCDDPDCWYVRGCWCIEEDCEDGFDDDGDGLTDCNDPDCAFRGFHSCRLTTVRSCFDPPFCLNVHTHHRNICEPPPCGDSVEKWSCDDGIDGDGDGLTDCDDPGCARDSDCAKETDCFDGVDNNGDGATDCDDHYCARVYECRVYRRCVERDCRNGVDDDGDGLTDCDDPVCAEETLCTREVDCFDGRDNDADGAVDCQEPNCSCDDGDRCTSEVCEPDGRCSYTPILGCCNADGDCDDGDACTTDVCDGSNCLHTAVAGCCRDDGDCGDLNLCTEDRCVGGRCENTPITNCCFAADSECDDGRWCTTDRCVDHRCSNDLVYPGCCESDPECEDGDRCTVDTCDVAQHRCDNAQVPDCCVADGDCDDGNPCTDGACDLASFSCSFTANTATCDDGSVCTTGDTCVGGACVGTIVAPGGQPCDGPDSDQCARGLWTCKADGSGFECVNESVTDLAERCNDFDDDCDGATDEDFPDKGSPCDGPDADFCPGGTWICGQDGDLVCHDPAPQTVCAEVCEGGQDEDQDGLVDCRDPDCHGTVGCRETSCFNGTDDDQDGLVDCDDPDCFVGDPDCEPSAEVLCADGLDDDGDGHTDCADSDCLGLPQGQDGCNMRDDDCDGDTDEDAVRPTTCGIGACAAVGTTTCAEGVVGDTCTPGTPAADDALCDGVDGDCDGATDEDFPSVPTSCGVGACFRHGQRNCVNGAPVDTCAPGPAAADDATCDGVDDDCDGATDEDFVAGPSTCGVGACAATGVKSCADGQESDTCTPGEPAEFDDGCDGRDDDCDGDTDEEFDGGPSSCGVGACAATGLRTCVDGVETDTCQPGAAAADDSLCNGADDDCDGTTDEDVDCGDGEPCTTDSCGGAAGCLNVPRTGSCDDGDPCTLADGCVDGACVGTPRDCDDGDPCTLDTCDAASGCAHEPDPSVCDDGDPCTRDVCDPWWGCSYEWLEDWQQCEGGVCLSGECFGSAPCDDGNTVDWDGCTRGFVTEFVVNSMTTGYENDPEVDAAPDGRFTVTWSSSELDGSFQGVGVRSFSADGTPLGPDRVATAETFFDQGNPAVSVADDGSAVVVWEGFSAETNEEGWLRTVGADGVPAGGDVLLRDADGMTRPNGARVDHVDSDAVWTVWDIDDGDGTWGVECALHELTGPGYVRTRVYDAALWDYCDPDIVALAGGGAAVVWSADTGDGNDKEVWLQLMSSEGAPVGDAVRAHPAAARGQGRPRVASLGASGFVVVWETQGDGDTQGDAVVGRRFALDGTPLTPVFPLHDSTWQARNEPAVDGWDDGRFAVSWSAQDTSGVSWDIDVRLFDTTGAPLAPPARVNVYGPGDQRFSSVAAFADGFIVVWEAPGMPLPQDGIVDITGQRFDRDGVRLPR